MYTLIAGLGLWVLERCYLACVQWNEDTRGMLVGAGKTRWASLPGRIRPMTLLFRNWISNIARDEQLISHIFHWISPQQKWVSWFSAVFSTIFLNCFPCVGSWFHTCEIFSYFACSSSSLLPQVFKYMTNCLIQIASLLLQLEHLWFSGSYCIMAGLKISTPH